MFKNKVKSQLIVNDENFFLKKSSVFEYTHLMKIINLALDEMILIQLIKDEESRELSFYFTNNNEMHKINREYRGKDSSTDVLAFPFLSEEIIGEIIISLDQIMKQADEYNVSYLNELSKMIIHGILHILGYDHETKEEEKLMFNLQDKILSEVLKKI